MLIRGLLNAQWCTVIWISSWQLYFSHMVWVPLKWYRGITQSRFIILTYPWLCKSDNLIMNPTYPGICKSRHLIPTYPGLSQSTKPQAVPVYPWLSWLAQPGRVSLFQMFFPEHNRDPGCPEAPVTALGPTCCSPCCRCCCCAAAQGPAAYPVTSWLKSPCPSHNCLVPYATRRAALPVWQTIFAAQFFLPVWQTIFAAQFEKLCQ